MTGWQSQAHVIRGTRELELADYPLSVEIVHSVLRIAEWWAGRAGSGREKWKLGGAVGLTESRKLRRVSGNDNRWAPADGIRQRLWPV